MFSEINTQAMQLNDELIKFRRDLHENPELSFQEFITSKKIFSRLQEEGIPCNYIYEQIGVVATIEGGKPGKTVALRADIDALPLCEQTNLEFSSTVKNVMHACGHDIHTTILIGTAIILWRNREKLSGKIRLIFQPAEERLGGSKLAISSGVINGVDQISTIHCWPDIESGTIGFKKGSMMASSDSVKIIVTGKGGHAAHPHRCIDPITVTAAIISTLQTIISREIAPLDSAVLSFGKIAGGTASNIIPETVECEGSVRTLTPQTQQLMEEKINRVATNVALAMNAHCEVIYEKSCPPVINDNEMVEKAQKAVAEILGEENIRQLETASMGSEDFAYYLQNIPGMLIRVGTNTSDPSTKLGLHNPSIIFDEGAILTGVKALCAITYDQLTN